jgi:hypothetical protein
MLDLESGKIKDFIKFDIGNLAMVTGGHNCGRVGTIVHKEKHKGGHDIVHVEDGTGKRWVACKMGFRERGVCWEEGGSHTGFGTHRAEGSRPVAERAHVPGGLCPAGLAPCLKPCRKDQAVLTSCALAINKAQGWSGSMLTCMCAVPAAGSPPASPTCL